MALGIHIQYERSIILFLNTLEINRRHRIKFTHVYLLYGIDVDVNSTSRIVTLLSYCLHRPIKYSPGLSTWFQSTAGDRILLCIAKKPSKSS
jgi:hypothetical protein